MMMSVYVMNIFVPWIVFHHSEIVMLVLTFKIMPFRRVCIAANKVYFCLLIFWLHCFFSITPNLYGTQSNDFFKNPVL